METHSCGIARFSSKTEHTDATESLIKQTEWEHST